MSFYMEKQRTTSTPYILIDEANSFLRLEGRCFNEKVVEFFKDVNDWLVRYLDTNFGTFTFECALEYFNSSTTKLLLNILLMMDRKVSAQKKIIVNWITTTDNDIMIECGEDFREEVENLEFNLVVG